MDRSHWRRHRSARRRRVRPAAQSSNQPTPPGTARRQGRTPPAPHRARASHPARRGGLTFQTACSCGTPGPYVPLLQRTSMNRVARAASFARRAVLHCISFHRTSTRSNASLQRALTRVTSWKPAAPPQRPVSRASGLRRSSRRWPAPRPCDASRSSPACRTDADPHSARPAPRRRLRKR